MALFQTGGQFPPENDLPRLAKYKRMKSFFTGKQWETYDRARKLLDGTPKQAQLDQLYIALNLPSVLTTKAADLLVGERPLFEAGTKDSDPEQVALNSYVEENDLPVLIHESATANGYRGDAWIKVRFGYRQDYSEHEAAGLPLPDDAKMEPIIEHVNASTVFPETSTGNVKQFKAINIATVEWVDTRKEEIPFLNVERHIAGYIFYEKYRLHTRPEVGVSTEFGVPITLYTIGDRVATGREEDREETGLPHIPVFHAPYASIDDEWQGAGFVEKIEHAIRALEDRCAQLDFLLWKHADPTLYGPDLDGSNTVRLSGAYIPITKEDATPGAITWDGQLDGVFKEIDLLLSYIYQMSETPQWLFGTTISGGGNAGGSGTSHTDSGAIKARFLPILSKVNRIRAHYDKAVRDALWTCYLFDKSFGNYKGEAVYPSVTWRDGIPRDEKLDAEVAAIRTGNKPTIDQHSAIKWLDEVDDDKATQILDRIGKDDAAAVGTVSSSIFNAEVSADEKEN